MFDTKVMVAPNSPSARANASTPPAMIPGMASGRVTVRNARAGPAPSVAAAASRRRSMASNDSRIARTISGNAMMPQHRAGPAERQHDAELSQQGSERALAAEQDQQEIPGDDRRQHERQQHEAIDERLAPERFAREHIGHPDADRQ